MSIYLVSDFNSKSDLSINFLRLYVHEINTKDYNTNYFLPTSSSTKLRSTSKGTVSS